MVSVDSHVTVSVDKAAVKTVADIRGADEFFAVEIEEQRYLGANSLTMIVQDGANRFRVAGCCGFL